MTGMDGVRRVALAGAMLVATTMAAPAWADDKKDFELCDGLSHPGKEADGMRGQAGRSSWTAVAANSETAAACTRALASPRLLPTQTLRRVHLLRARAATQLQAGDQTAALADLDAAETAAAPLKDDRFYQRSMGASLQLLRAIAHAQQGNFAAATPLAQAAVTARPYSLQVQQVGALILQSPRPASTPSPWLNVARLEPAATSLVLMREAEDGNFAGLVAAADAAPPIWPTERLAPFAFQVQAPEASAMLSAMVASCNVAYARAATGDVAGARRDLATLRAKVEALRPLPAAGGAQPVPGLDRFLDLRARQIDARIAVAEKRYADAIKAIDGAALPGDAATTELFEALKPGVPAKSTFVIPETDAFRTKASADRREMLMKAIPQAMIAAETPRAVIDYSRARPNILGAIVGASLSFGTSLLGGISRTDGFRSTDNPDGTVTVEFIGNTPSPVVVQEMTLLRAAEVARAAGKPAFAIVKREDLARRLVSTQYGREISSVPTGFKTILTIRPLAAGEQPARSLDTTTVIDALGPLYYEEKKKA